MPVDQISSINLRPHIHLSSYIRAFMDYLNNQVLASQMQTLVVGNYNKIIQYLTDYDKRNLDAPLLPLLSGNFQLIGLEEKTNHPWRHITKNNNYLASLLYEPVYKDDKVQIVPIFERFTGQSEIIVIAHSSPQLHDFQFLFLQWFDTNKWFLVPRFETRMLVPVEMIAYEYVNETTGTQYTVDLSNTAYEYLVRSMDQTHFVFPIHSRPMVRISSITDGTTFYGSAELPAFRLNVTFDWEIELPAYVVLFTDYKIEKIKRNIMINGEITTDFYNPNDPLLQDGDSRAIEQSHPIKIGDTIIENGKMTHEIRIRKDVKITEDHSDGPPFEITLPEPIGDNKLVLVSYWGIMREYYEYIIKNDTTLEIKVPFKKDDYISVYYYQPIQ